MLLETLLAKINKLPDNIQGEMQRLEKKIDTKDITLKKGSVGVDNLDMELGLKLINMPENTNAELQLIRDSLNNATIADGSIDEAKLNAILKEKINSINKIGDLNSLTTDNKNTIVESINEVSNKVNEVPISLTTNLNEAKSYTDTKVGKIKVPTITFGTGNPSGGKHGDIYIKHA